MRKQTGPPPSDRAVLAYELAVGRWAFCTPTPLGWVLDVHGEERPWVRDGEWPEDNWVWYDLPVVDADGYGKMGVVPLARVAEDLKASLRGEAGNGL